jgi:CRP-like cAMP-binding protein
VRPLEAVLGAVSIFAQLRPDENGRIARRFTLVSLGPGETYSTEATPETARLVVVVSGHLDAVFEDPAGQVRKPMRPGDRYGDASLLGSTPKAMQLKARSHSQLATIDRASLEAILAEFPAVALPLAAELASELRARNDQVRQVADLLASGQKSSRIETAISHLRQSMIIRGVGVRHMSTGGLFRRLVVDRGSEPPFWMLVGFLGGLAGARLVVHLILKYKLEKQLFALVAGTEPNPMHVHHFNYGLIIVGAVGMLALSPFGRRSLRTLSVLFGLGCGLIFDEFALFWNLNPEYSQGLSLISAAIAGAVLVQLAYFRRFWLALCSRILQGIRSE